MVMTNMNQLGVKMKLLGSPAYGISDALKLAKEAANGSQVIMDWVPNDEPGTVATSIVSSQRLATSASGAATDGNR